MAKDYQMPSIVTVFLKNIFKKTISKSEKGNKKYSKTFNTSSICNLYICNIGIVYLWRYLIFKLGNEFSRCRDAGNKALKSNWTYYQ